jgi:hypothetical protein
MKAKLIKIDKDNYTLFDEKGIPIGATPNVLSNNTFSKLSKQNCDEIFGVVDVEKLTKEEVLQEYYDWGGEVFREDYLISKRLHFIEGFNKAMELYQPTEIEVEIVMEYVGKCNGNNNNGCFQDSSGHNCGCFNKQPKLDSNGCIILKKI